jgi:glycosyltransferase involved in cell wall biosynthesis
MARKIIPVVIPVYNPPTQFVPFVRTLRKKSDAPLIIINDGSGEDFRSLFRSLQHLSDTFILTHNRNKGKGAALKTAMQHILHTMPDAIGIITADADGQHVSNDIIACDALARILPPTLLIGTRVERTNMPLTSRTGNTLTRAALRILHGKHVGDTQSGLRYVPSILMEHSVKSIFDKYDFELDMLILAIQEHIPIVEFPIETIYINKNKASHFKTLKDSLYVARVFTHHLGKRIIGRSTR